MSEPLKFEMDLKRLTESLEDYVKRKKRAWEKSQASRIAVTSSPSLTQIVISCENASGNDNIVVTDDDSDYSKLLELKVELSLIALKIKMKQNGKS